MNKAPKLYDAWTAYQAGKAFYANAGDFFDQIPQDLNESAQFVARRLGRVIASVTNLTLGIELYLKCLAILTGSRVQKTHDLVSLFGALPSDLKTSLESRYNLKTKHLPKIPAALELFITLSASPPNEDELHAARSNRRSGKDDLRTLLSNEKDAFQTWRYLHEGRTSGEVMFYCVEYYYLGVLASVLEEHIEPLTSKLKERYHG